ncbi:PREDICTED: uncharacterized protein LOC108567744 [Nicrophorus vespilloides]|uniref:Uncharacterized protein LOC108567744 n=1 Tax=Nicrophorus vespilloides TaxID=110193 RepID=A0ABM1NAM3_NICVS|nr:PREDICTED: uncharacterized protein LOC108567744 [Nicrophorus vespilloides]
MASTSSDRPASPPLSQSMIEDDELFGRYLMNKIKMVNARYKTFLKVMILEMLVSTSKNMQFLSSIEEVSYEDSAPTNELQQNDDEQPNLLNPDATETLIPSARNDYTINLEVTSSKEDPLAQNEEQSSSRIVVKTTLASAPPDPPGSQDSNQEIDDANNRSQMPSTRRTCNRDHVSPYMQDMLRQNRYKKVTSENLELHIGAHSSRTFRIEKMGGRTMVYERLRGPEYLHREQTGLGPSFRRLPLVPDDDDDEEMVWPTLEDDPDLKRFWDDLKKL